MNLAVLNIYLIEQKTMYYYLSSEQRRLILCGLAENFLEEPCRTLVDFH